MARAIDTAFVEILPDLDKFDRQATTKVKAALKSVEKAAASTARDIEDSFEDAFDGAGRDARRLSAQLEREFDDIIVNVRVVRTGDTGSGLNSKTFRKQGESLGKDLGAGVTGGFTSALSGLGGVLTQALGPLKVAAITSLVALAIDLVGALGPATVALAATLPSAIGVAVAAFATLKLAFGSFNEAIKNVGDIEKFNEAIKKLTPSARSVAIEVRNLLPAFQSIRDAVQESVFAPLQGELTRLITALRGPLIAAFTVAGNAVGRFILQLTGFISSTVGIELINALFGTLAQTLDTLGPALTPFLTGITALIVAAQPFIQSLNAGIASFLTSIGNSLSEAAKSGELQKFFDEALVVLKLLVDVVKELGPALKEIFKAAGPAGIVFLTMVKDVSKEISKFLSNKGASAALTAIFLALLPAIAPVFFILKALNAVFTALDVAAAVLGRGISNLGVFFRNIGINIGRAAENVANAGKNIIDSFGGVSTFFDNLGKNITGAFDNVGTFFDNLWTNIRTNIVNAWNNIIDFFKELPGRILKALTTPDLATVLGRAVAQPIAALIKGVFAAIRGLKAVGTFFAELWESIRVNTVNAFNNIVAFFTGVPGQVEGAVTSGFDNFKAFFANLWESIRVNTVNTWNNIVTFFSLIPTRIVTAISSVGTNLSTFFTNLWENIRTGVVNAFNAVVDTVKSVPGRLLSLVGTFIDAGKGIIKGFLNGLKAVGGFASEVGEAIVRAVKDGLNFAIRFINGAIDTINSAIPGNPITFRIKELAAGGITQGPTSAIIGESGPEAVLPLSGQRGRRVLEALGAGNGGQVLNFLAGAVAVSFSGVVPTETEATRTGEAVGMGIAAALQRRDIRVQIRAV